MSSKPNVESRRSTRVPLKVVIRERITNRLICDGETIIVNLHGALISTPMALSKGMRIQIQVFLTDKRAQADVVYVDPDQPRLCGIGLLIPENIWGLSFPPDDWHDAEPDSVR